MGRSTKETQPSFNQAKLTPWNDSNFINIIKLKNLLLNKLILKPSDREFNFPINVFVTVFSHTHTHNVECPMNTLKVVFLLILDNKNV